MIDITTEQLKLLTRAAADVPGRPHVSTLIRWARNGVKGVRLETVIIGGRRYTSVEAVQRFVREQNAAGPGTAGASGRDTARVDRLLDDAGL